MWRLCSKSEHTSIPKMAFKYIFQSSTQTHCRSPLTFCALCHVTPRDQRSKRSRARPHKQQHTACPSPRLSPNTPIATAAARCSTTRCRVLPYVARRRRSMTHRDSIRSDTAQPHRTQLCRFKRHASSPVIRFRHRTKSQGNGRS